MPDHPPLARGQDVAGDNQPPDQMRYADWARLGFCYGWIEYMRGAAVIPRAADHRRAMRAAGYLTGAYAAISHGDILTQARTFLDLVPDGDELPDMLDVEKAGLTADEVRAWCDFHDANTDRALVIYTSVAFWPTIVPADKAAHYKKYKLIVAQYFFDTPDKDAAGNPQPQPMDPASVARRSNPPSSGKPSLPSPWTDADVLSWQHTGHGSLPGFGNFLDLHVARTTEADFRRLFSSAAPVSRPVTIDAGPLPNPTPIPAPTHSPQVPLVAKGTKLGIGQVLSGPALQFVRLAHDHGAPLAGAFGMDNAGVAIDAKDLVTFRLTRIVQGETEAAPGMDDHPSDDSLRQLAARQVELYVHRLNADEKAAASFILPWNEPRPATVEGYVALTKLMFFTADACEAHGFHFLAYAFNAGTPEWDETLAMWAATVQGEAINARLIRGGHGISIHHGVLDFPGAVNPDRMDDTILGTSLKKPGTTVELPFLANADALVLRYRFLKLAADRLNVALAPLFGTEFYPSTKPIRQCDPDDLARRYAWLDNQLAQDAYYRAVFPYAVGSGGVGMPDTNHAPIWPKLVDHVVQVKDRANAAAGPAPTARWWAALPSGLFSPNLPLPTPTNLIPMRDETGQPFPGVFRQNGMEARERRDNLFRVLDTPINDQMWWVMAEDLPLPAG